MDFDLSALYEQQVNESVVAEGTAYKTIRSGVYRALAAKLEGRKMEETSQKTGNAMPWPNRNMLHIQFNLEDAEGAKKGSQFIDISWEVWRDVPNSDPMRQVKETDENRDEVKSYPLDKLTKFWSQTVKALDKQKATIGEVINALKETYVNVYVTEYFKDPNNPSAKARYYKTEGEREQLVKDGWEPKNVVSSISKVK